MSVTHSPKSCKCEKTFIPMTLEIEPKINIIVNEPDICIQNRAICIPSYHKPRYETKYNSKYESKYESKPRYESKHSYPQSDCDSKSNYSECSSCYDKKSKHRKNSSSSRCSSCHKKFYR